MIFLGLNWEALSQGNITNTPLKRGIFRTYEDFKYNRPDTTFDIEFFEKPGVLVVDTTRKIVRKLKWMWGFCDSSSVYIRSNRYCKIQTIGRYCFFESKRWGFVVFLRGDIPLAFPFPAPYRMRYVINLNNGNYYNLHNRLMKRILKKDVELLQHFKNEKKKKKKYLQYIKAYNERHKDELKIN